MWPVLRIRMCKKMKHLNIYFMKCSQNHRIRTASVVKEAFSRLRVSSSLLAFLIAVISLFQSTPATAQQVSPFQTGHYMTSFANVRDYGKMSAGLFIIPYNYYGWGNSYADRDGQKHSSIFLQDIDPGLPNAELTVNVNAFATVPAFFWGSKFTLLGGATYVAGITPSYSWSNVLVVAKLGVPILDKVYTENAEAKLSGFADLNVIPFGLSWGGKRFDATFYYAFTAPTGRYETGADDNIGLGFWTHQFQGFGYWYPDVSQATALMLGLTYEANTKIKGEELNPGDRLSLEWGLSQYLSERFELNVIGGHNWQIVDDKGDDVFWDASYHDRKSTVAFGIAYWAVKERLYISGKYMFDYGARQRFLTNGIMLNLIFVTNALDGVKSNK